MLQPWPITLPAPSTTIAPTGTSPVDNAVRASSSAARIRASYATLTCATRGSRGGEADGLVEQRSEPEPARHLGERLVGVEVDVVEQLAHVHGTHAEVPEEIEVSGR